MSNYPSIQLIGESNYVKPVDQILREIKEIHDWSSQDEDPIVWIEVNTGRRLERLRHLETAIENRTLDEYIIDFLDKRLTIKTDGQSNFLIVDNPDYMNDEGGYKKKRKKNTHLTPKKKRR